MSDLTRFVLILGLLSPKTAEAQVPSRSLSQSDGRIAEPFLHIAAIAELRDGRTVLVDANEQRVLIVDFQKSTATPIGRIGAGPGEYRFPSRLLRLGGDSIGVVDRGNARILVITPSGKFGGVLDLFGMPLSNRASARAAAPEASDGRGWLYALGSDPFADQASQDPDSAPLERWRVGSSARDTVAYVPLPPVKQRLIMPGEARLAFATEPQWVAGPAGQVAILHVAPYSVDLITPGGATIRGKPIPYKRLRVTAAHKELWTEDQKRPRPVTMMQPGSDASPTAGLRAVPDFIPVEWPTYLPAFLDDAGFYAPDGVLWVSRTTAAEGPPIFDLINEHGIPSAQVVAPPHTRLIGFGRRHLYLARTDSDGQEFAERYPLPQH